jgi:hypothetical protein
MRVPSVWKGCAQHRFHNIAKEVISVVIVLLSHQIDGMKSIEIPKDGQHELLCPDVLLYFLRDPVVRCTLSHRMMKYRREPTPIAGEKSSKFTFLVGFEDGQQLSVGTLRKLSVNSWGILRK